MSCTPSSSKQTRNIRNLDSAKRIERPLDYISQQATTGKTPVKRKRLVKACDACHKSKRRCDGMAPCDNCYYASKDCIYTDSSGRPVPAPNAPRPESNIATGTAPTLTSTEHIPSKSAFHQTDASLMTNAGAPDPSAFVTMHMFESTLHHHHSLGDNSQAGGGGLGHVNYQTRKHPTSELDSLPRILTNGTLTQESPKELFGPNTSKADNSHSRSHEGTISPIVYHKHIIRELVNLFFAHCHPQRLIIHATSFHSDLYRNRVPLHLLNAICAVAAPLSHNPLIREEPVRESGEKFAQAALRELLDADGRPLISTLEAAQALVLIQAYEVYRNGNMDGYMTYFDLSLRILHAQNLLSPSHNGVEIVSQLTPEEMCLRIIRRECARRTFWLVHMIELLGATFTRRPMMYKKEDLEGVRLPCDEASFDLALEAEPEYLDAPALKTSDASEFGHIIRAANLLLEVEANSVTTMNSQSISHCEFQIEQWALTLPDHLKYTPKNLRMQLSLWETGSNTTLSDMRRAIGMSPCRGHQNALAAIPAVMNGIGPRARNSILLGCVLWLQYCGPHATYQNKAQKGVEVNSIRNSASFSEVNGSNGIHDNMEPSAAINELLPQLDLWIKEWEEFWGPATMHAGGGGGGSGGGGDGSQSQPLIVGNGKLESSGPSSAGSNNNNKIKDNNGLSSGFGSCTLMSAPTAEGSGLHVSNVVVNSSLHSEAEGVNLDSVHHHQAASSSSEQQTNVFTSLRGGGVREREQQQQQPCLPSLKASGLLEVTADDTPDRSSVTSTSAKSKQALAWTLSSASSQHPGFLSGVVPGSSTINSNRSNNGNNGNTGSNGISNNAATGAGTLVIGSESSGVCVNGGGGAGVGGASSNALDGSPVLSDNQVQGVGLGLGNGGGGFQALRVPHVIRQLAPPVHVPSPEHHQHQQYYHPLPHHQRQFGQSGIQHRRLQPNDPRRNNTLSQGIVGVVGDTSGGDYQHQQPQHQDVIMESEASASMYIPRHGNGMV